MIKSSGKTAISLNLVVLLAIAACNPVGAYTSVLQVSGDPLTAGESEETYEERLIKSVAADLAGKHFDPQARVNIEVDESGNLVNGNVLNSATKSGKDLKSELAKTSFGALPTLYEPASLALSFLLAEAGGKKLGRCAVTLSTQSLPTWSINADGSIKAGEGGLIGVGEEASVKRENAWSPITREDIEFCQNLLLVYSKSCRMHRRNNSGAESSDSTEAILKAEGFLKQNQVELALNFFLLSVEMASNQNDFTLPEGIAQRIADLALQLEDKKRVSAGVRLLDVFNPGRQRNSSIGLTSQDLANAKQIERIFAKSCDSPVLEVNRLKSIKRLKLRLQVKDLAAIDTQIAAITKIVERDYLSAQSMQEYQRLLKESLAESDYKKAGQTAEQFLALTEKYDATKQYLRIPALRAQLDCALNQKNYSVARAHLKEIDQALMNFYVISQDRNELGQPYKFLPLDSNEEQSIVKELLSNKQPDEFKVELEKTEYLSKVSSVGCYLDDLEQAAKTFVELGKAGLALKLYDDAIVYLECLHSDEDVVAVQKYKLNLFKQYPDLPGVEQSIAKTYASLNRVLERSIKAQDDVRSANRLQFQLLENYLSEKSTVDANQTLRAVISAMRIDTDWSHQIGSYYDELWKLLGCLEENSKVIDLNLVHQFACVIVENDTNIEKASRFQETSFRSPPNIDVASPVCIDTLSLMASAVEKKFGVNSKQLKEILTHLIEGYSKGGNYDAAIAAANHLLRVVGSADFGAEEILKTELTLAQLKLNVGAYKESAVLFQNALSKSDSASTIAIAALSDYAMACAKLKQLAQAEDASRKIVDLVAIQGTPVKRSRDHRPLRSTFSSAYACVELTADGYRDAGKYSEAAALLSYAVEKLVGLSGPAQDIVSRWNILLANEYLAQAEGVKQTAEDKAKLLQQSKQAFANAIQNKTPIELHTIWLYNWAIAKRIVRLNKLGEISEAKSLGAHFNSDAQSMTSKTAP